MHSCPLATMSIPHVNKCIALFRRAKDTCSKATLFLPVLEDIFEKSQAILIKSSSMQEDGEHSGYGMRWLEFPLTAAFGDFGVGQNPSSIKATDPFTNVHPILMRLLKQMQARAMTRQTQNDRRNFPSQTSSYLESPGVINASETSSPSLNWDSGLGDMGPTLHSARNFSAFSSAPDHGPIPVYSPRHSAASPSSSTLIRPSNASPTNFPGGMASMGSTWPPANHAASPSFSLPK
ncbi:hypothetical protein OF83DRAFT_656453 [Amylostereum chailletii]|nr:hypothetical protein OF83DRAFT_656453 [Amylostereum chailletii]